MGRWRRRHLNGSLKSLVMQGVGSESYGIIVLEPEGQRRISDQLTFANADTAMKIADDLVSNNYPHLCTEETCEFWETA